MQKIAKALAVVVCVAAATGAMAQEKKLSVSAQGNYMKTDNTDASGSMIVGLGYLATTQLEVGVQLMTIYSSSTMNFVQLAGQYYFKPVGKANQLTPYVKADFGTSSGGGASYSNYGGFGGVSYALSESAEAFVEAGLQTVKYSSNSANQSNVNFGLKFRF